MPANAYFFGDGKAEGNAQQKNLLGGKGANLAEMTKLGLPVPSGFTITTSVCTHFYQSKGEFPPGFESEVNVRLEMLEKSMGAKFGDPKNPLLVSVRSGARVSMPGMMDTILNLGLNDKTAEGLAEKSGDARFAYDAYRRFIQMYGDVVLGISSHEFETLLIDKKTGQGLTNDYELPVESLKELVAEFKDVVQRITGKAFPEDPKEQLWGAISAVFNSWMSARAVSYRRINRIPEEWGTAVNVQAMVFGNMGMDSATGVAFTRDPSTGEKKFFGEYLRNAQGEDVVAGIRTPHPLNAASATGEGEDSLEKSFAKPYAELVEIYQKLEKHYRDMQDIEFTIQQGKLYLLQTRVGKRAPSAAIRIAVEMVEEGLISKDEAIERVSPSQVEQLLHPRLDPSAKRDVIARGLPASPGAASGEVVFSSEEAENYKKAGKDVVLVRHETSPEDIAGMDASTGILTALGGMTSHAAVVARGMGKPCVSGCGEINIDYNGQQFTVGSTVVKKGDVITIDGSTGEVMTGLIPTVNSQLDDRFSKLMSWVDERRKLKVYSNSDTPNDAKVARQFGAEGVGLCRTEHMFFGDARITAMREMILAETSGQREEALAKLFPMQKEDFAGIFREMKGLPVTIRLLDPPLHEFLPQRENEIEQMARVLGTTPGLLQGKIKLLHELNPMLGHRGCRLAISYPEIYRMQASAIMEAACELNKREGFNIEPEIMVPFVSSVEELRTLKTDIMNVCEEISKREGAPCPVRVGTMIEIPRAALTADEIAKEADFFSFGTNDLTQMTMGLSRDDSGSFLPPYVDKGIFAKDPFTTLDRTGVGQLVDWATQKGRATKPELKIGICGEHGGDTESIEFCSQLGFNYVSCSPFRVPVARLAAAQAELKKQKSKSTH